MMETCTSGMVMDDRLLQPKNATRYTHVAAHFNIGNE